MTNSNLTIGQEKAIALMQYHGYNYFIIELEDECKVYEGIEEEAIAEFLRDIEGTEEADISENFNIFCSNRFIEVEEYDDNNDDYLVLTDEEADERVKEEIENSVWAFTPSFLSEQTEIDVEVFEAIQNNGRCESNNKAILSMIDDIDEFCEEAVRYDGRGHFLSRYDGHENDEFVNGNTYYIYRQN